MKPKSLPHCAAYSLVSTIKPCHFGLVELDFTKQSVISPVLLLEDFDHRLKVADVYRFAEDAFRVVVCDDFTDAGHEGLVHWTVGVELSSTGWERAVKRSTHDGLPAKCQARS
jgi:hypothetical protein